MRVFEVHQRTRVDSSNPRPDKTGISPPDPGAPLPDGQPSLSRVDRTLGTARVLVGQTVFVAVWISINVVAVRLRWDPYPFILLNLAFSTQAAYAAPLILLAQNRQDEREREAAQRDREMNARTLADTEFISRELAAIRIALQDVVTTSEVSVSVSLDHRN